MESVHVSAEGNLVCLLPASSRYPAADRLSAACRTAWTTDEFRFAVRG